MLVNNAKTRGTVSGFYPLLSIALLLLILAFMLVFWFNAAKTSADVGASFSVYRSETNRFSISYPTDWQIGAGNEQAGVTTIASSLAKNTQEGGLIDPRSYRTTPSSTMNNFSKIDVLSFTVDEGTTAREFLNSRSKPGIIGQSSEIKVDGTTAIRLDVDMAEAAGNHTVSKIYTSIYITKGNHGYIIAGFANSDVLEKIIASFRVW
jgi:hypothetical protein